MCDPRHGEDSGQDDAGRSVASGLDYRSGRRWPVRLLSLLAPLPGLELRYDIALFQRSFPQFLPPFAPKDPSPKSTLKVCYHSRWRSTAPDSTTLHPSSTGYSSPLASAKTASTASSLDDPPRQRQHQVVAVVRERR